MNSLSFRCFVPTGTLAIASRIHFSSVLKVSGLFVLFLCGAVQVYGNITGSSWIDSNHSVANHLSKPLAGAHNFCINYTVAEVKSHMAQMSDFIHLSWTNKTCKSFYEYNRKQKEKLMCDSTFYPSIMGSQYVRSNHRVNTSHMRTRSDTAYWIGILPDLEWYGNFYLDFFIFERFFRKAKKHRGDSTTRFYAPEVSDILMKGTYLETGGSDGVSASNTLFFDRFLKWNGILIEPTVCADHQIPFNRPDAISFRGGICDTESKIDVSDMKNFCPDDGGYTRWNEPTRCAPIKTYWDEAIKNSSMHHDKKIGKTIDFMSIDVEKYYMSVLRTIPFNVDDYNIRVLAVECKTQDCYDLLQSKGYNILPAGSIRYLGDDTIAWKNDCV